MNFQSKWVLSLAILLVAGCGTGDGGGNESGGEAPPVELGNVPFSSEVEGAGFTVVDYKPFPTQQAGRRGSVVVYRDKSGKKGGILYLQKLGNSNETVHWHWYFGDAAPDSAQAVELNEDGLWDVRVFMRNGDTVDFIQDKSFTLLAPAGSHVAAMNGEASAAGDQMWKCFDGDTASAWVSPLDSKGAYVEIPTPFGLESGTLSVTLQATRQPKAAEILVDGKKTQEIELSPTTRKQEIKLEPAAQDARSVRIVFKSAQSGSEVAVAELGLK